MALTGVVVLVGIAGGALWWQSAGEAEAQRTRLLDAARSELDREPIDREGARTVARQIAKLRAAGDPAEDLLIAECELRIVSDDANGAWDLLAGPVSLPGASAALQDVASRALAAVASRSGRSDQFRQAATLAASHARATDSPESLLRAFLLAFRAGSARLLAEYGLELLERHERSSEAEAVRALGADLVGWVAERAGLERSALGDDGGDVAFELGRLAEAVGAPGSASEVDALRLQLGDPPPPEVLLVLAARGVESVGAARDDAAQTALFDSLDRLSLVLERMPSSLEARHVAAVVYFGVWQARGELEGEDRARFVGHLDWLLRNAPDDHLRMPTWRAMREALGG